MRILFRYVLREFAIPLFYCTAGFLSIFILFELFGSFNRMVEASPSAGEIVRYFAGYMAPFFQWLMPAALLLATLYTMWNFCRHSEITAMRASGVGFAAIVRPVLAAAVACAGAVVFVNEWFVPRHTRWAEEFRESKFRRTELESHNLFATVPSTGRRWMARKALSPDASALETVTVSDGTWRIEASKAAYLDGQWWFSKDDPSAPWRTKDTGAPSPSPLDALGLYAPGFEETPRDLVLASVGQGIGKNDLNSLSTADRFAYIEAHPQLTPQARTRNIYDAWARAAAPFACIVITLFAIPAGVATGRQSIFRGVLGAIGMFFAFFALTIACNVACALLADSGWSVDPAAFASGRVGAFEAFFRRATPVAAAFAPAVAFLAIGWRLFRKHR